MSKQQNKTRMSNGQKSNSKCRSNVDQNQAWLFIRLGHINFSTEIYDQLHKKVNKSGYFHTL